MRKSEDATHFATDGPAPRRYDGDTAAARVRVAVFVRSEKSNALLGYPGSGPVCGERTLATAQKLSERPNRAGIISICPLHNIVGV